jgi:hypothetical protein
MGAAIAGRQVPVLLITGVVGTGKTAVTSEASGLLRQEITVVRLQTPLETVRARIPGQGSRTGSPVVSGRRRMLPGG